METVKLRAELRDDSRYVATATPRLSWTVETAESNWLQSSVEVAAGDERVTLHGQDSVLVAWPFAPLTAGEARAVRVRVTATSGTTTPWSDELAVEAGFVEPGAWVATPIGLAAPQREAQPALLRKDFTIDRPVLRARLFYTALGAADLELNGQPVDDGVLAPGWTTYQDRLVHETVDVTALLTEGANTLGAQLAGAWFTEKYGFFQYAHRVYGDQPSLLAQLEIEFHDGTTTTIVSDGTWLARGDGPIFESSIYGGEHHDARRAIAGWSTAGADTAGWMPVRVSDEESPVPEARIAPPVRRIEERAVVAVLSAPSGARILDFGQNLVGRLRIRVTGPAGTALTLRHAEVLDAGELALRPLRNAIATDVYVLSGDGEEVWEPRFTFHGFRYAQIDGWPGEFDPAAVTAVVLHTDMRRTGWFDSSEPLLDRLHENVLWGMRGNFLSIPTDCPQRDERLGWTGDIQVFSPTASFLYDCQGFLQSWLRDLAHEQRRGGGAVPVVVPSVLDAFGNMDLVAAWGDAATVVPWVMYERFGDLGVLRDQYESITTWVEALLKQSAGSGLWADTFQLGDWLDPSAPPDKPYLAKVDSDIVASAYLARSLRIAADTADLLGEHGDAVQYSIEAEYARTSFVNEYVTPGGRMMSDAVTGYALALRFNLVTDPSQRERLGARLAELVRAGGYRIQTGFVGTPLVADALADSGHLDAAERLLTQTESPSWLYPVTMGATTVWERWDSMLPDGSINPGEMTSFNHYALGAVADWMHRTVAGLAPAAAGYRELRIAPRPLRSLDHAAARHLTPYGEASVEWRRDGDQITVTATVPANTTAHVDLGDGSPFTVGSGGYQWAIAADTVATPHGSFTLDSSTASVIDAPKAYRALLDTLAAADPALAENVRRDTVWADGRTVRQSLMFTPPAVLDAVEAALAAIS